MGLLREVIRNKFDEKLNTTHTPELGRICSRKKKLTRKRTKNINTKPNA